ncbi:MerR family transcriptional regulator [Clostridium oryzae]|uniref:Mercuric resistance operon regulatory protein n=1 Tax=Clostridium oryzae TaxID=1450648 RepID=A0A1V4IVU4_9CLOT|nr:MerR family transcriptional regulator [Clostridium oryzae]OPJ64013.1 mercuric resistance operon regulatory protein [Clostridium oryzae]
MAALMRINDVAKKYNITKRSLRYYEEVGLLNSRRIGASKSRYFDEAAINRLEQILLLRSVDFTINEISKVLLSDNRESTFEIFENRLKEIADMIDELNYCKGIIASFIKIGKSIGVDKVNIYQLLRDQIYVHNNDERMLSMEEKYEGDIIKVEFGVAIVPIVCPTECDNFLDKIKEMRNKIETETSKRIPLIRVLDNEELDEWQYRISIKKKVMLDNNLEIIAPEDRSSAMLSYLESIVKTSIDEICN